MPDASGRTKGISVPRIPWREVEAEDVERALCACLGIPCDLCVEQGGRCARGEDCTCRDGNDAEEGKWRSP